MHSQTPAILARDCQRLGWCRGSHGLERVLILIVVSLALAIAGGARAMALTHSMGAESLVICSEGGEEIIYLNAEGQPADPMVDCAKCPECLNGASAALPVAAAAQFEPPTRSADRFPPAAQDLVLSRHLRPQSRGPPFATPDMHGTALLAVRSTLGVRLPASPDDRAERAFPDARS